MAISCNQTLNAKEHQPTIIIPSMGENKDSQSSRIYHFLQVLIDNDATQWLFPGGGETLCRFYARHKSCKVRNLLDKKQQNWEEMQGMQ